MTTTVELNPGTGGNLVSVEQPGGSGNPVVEFCKIHLGDSDVDDGPVTDTNPLPVSDIGLEDVVEALEEIQDQLSDRLDVAVDPDGIPFRVRIADDFVVTSGTLLKNGGMVVAAASAKTGMAVAIGAGLTATVTPRVSFDGGKTFVQAYFDDIATGGTKAASVALAAATLMRGFVPVPGATHYAVVVTAYTSGAARCTLTAISGNSPSSLLAAGPTGIAVPPQAVLVGCSDGTLLRNILGDTSGRQAIVGAGASTGALTGNPVAMAGSIVDGAAISTHRGTMIGTKGSDGLYHHVNSDALGNVKVLASPSAYSVHSSSVVTSSSNSGLISAFGARCISLYYTISAATPSGGTMTYTVEELSADATTVLRSSSRTFSATGSNYVHLGSVNSYYVRVSWTLTGGSPSYTSTASLYMTSSAGSMNEAAPGDSIPGQTALVGGTDGGTLRSLAVAPSGSVRTSEGGVTTYTACFTDGTGTALSGGGTILTLWHASGNATPIHIRRITLTTGYGTIPAGCGIQWSVRHISAENGTPGGTSITASPVDRADAASSLTGGNGAIRSLPATPTAVSGSNLIEWMSGVFEDQFEWTSSAHGKPIELRASTAEGIEIRYDNIGTQTVGIIYSIAVEWTEGTAIT